MSKSKSSKWKRACRSFPYYAATESRDSIAASAYIPESLTRLVTSKPRGTYMSAGFASSAAPTPVVQPVAPKLAQPGLRQAVANLAADVLIDRLLTPETVRSPEHGNRQIPLLQIFIESVSDELNGALSRRDILEIVDQQIGLFAASGANTLARRKKKLSAKLNITIQPGDVPAWNMAIDAEHRRLNALGAMYASRRASQTQAERRGRKPEDKAEASGVSNPAAFYAEMPSNKAQFKSRTMRKGE